MSTRQTLKNYLSDRGLGSVNTISYNNTVTAGDSPDLLDEGDDLSFDPNTGKRLINDGRNVGLVTDYLSYITEQEGNTYPIDGSSFQEAASSDRGVSLEPPESQGAIGVFVSSGEYPVKPSYFDGSGNPVSTLLDKVGNGSAPSGPDLIVEVKSAESGADTQADQSKAVTAAFDMLKKYNKYADADGASDPRFVEPTYEGGTDTSATIDDAVRVGFQRSAGEYKLGDTSSSRQLPMRDLHAVAHSMLLKAAGWDQGTTAFDSADPQTFFDTFDDTNFRSYPDIISSLYPDQVRARETFGAPIVGEASLLANAGEAVPRDGADAIYSRASTSTYTPDIVFAPKSLEQGELAQLGLYQAAISIVELSRLLQETLIRQKTFTQGNGDPETLGLGPFYMGRTTQSKTDASFRAISNIALINTGRFTFEGCVRAGVTLYFGINIANVQQGSGVDIVAVNTIAGPGVNQSTQDRLAQSYGFWQSIAKTCVRFMSETAQALSNLDTTLYANLITSLLQSKALRIANVFAQIGYTYLIAHLEAPTDESQPVDPDASSRKLNVPFSIDSFETLPGTRVMKSRSGGSRSALSLAWRHSSVPSALLLPPALIQASLDMDYALEGPNPVKQMLSTTLQDKTYVSIRNIGRIPIEVVNNLENRLDAEYVPFYFHDLRTNEVVGLHAFLDSLTDNYSAQYSSTQVFGRSDAVKNYNSTKRSINFSFWLVSTSEDDFDEMWSKINKIVTFAYPQYTKGTMNVASNVEFNFGLSARDFKFEQPFSQVVGGTPVVRLRIGDVIKSNYSRFNLSRLFGAGNTETGAMPNKDASSLEKVLTTGLSSVARSGISPSANIFTNVALWPLLLTIASPAEILAISGIQAGPGAIATGLLADAADAFLVNGFVNPLLLAGGSNPTAGLLTGESGEGGGIPGLFQGDMRFSQSGGAFSGMNAINSIISGKIFLKPKMTPYVFAKDNQSVSVKVTRPLLIDVVNVSDLSSNPNRRTDSNGNPIKVTVSLSSLSEALLPPDSFIQPQANAGLLQSGATCDVTLDQCLFDPDAYFGATFASLMILGQGSSLQSFGAQAGSAYLSNASAAAGVPVGSTSLITDYLGSFMRQFTAPNANPITFAMEDSMSRGLAGVFTSINFTWIDQATAWDLRWNSRAPMACKITMGFDPIHDISPGLDVYGANRAPVYNVGNVRLVAGDPHPDNGLKSRTYYTRMGRNVMDLMKK